LVIQNKKASENRAFLCIHTPVPKNDVITVMTYFWLLS